MRPKACFFSLGSGGEQGIFGLKDSANLICISRTHTMAIEVFVMFKTGVKKFRVRFVPRPNGIWLTIRTGCKLALAAFASSQSFKMYNYSAFRD